MRSAEFNMRDSKCRAAYVGVNTWDLMDKSRYQNQRPEIQARLDAMVQVSAGHPLGFSAPSP
jgi:hypothetical protein